jgi:hypothetical protein
MVAEKNGGFRKRNDTAEDRSVTNRQSMDRIDFSFISIIYDNNMTVCRMRVQYIHNNIDDARILE